MEQYKQIKDQQKRKEANVEVKMQMQTSTCIVCPFHYLSWIKNNYMELEVYPFSGFEKNIFTW